MTATMMVNREDCRLCTSKNIKLALPMKDSAIGDAYVTRDELSVNQSTFPLSLYLCQTCGHLQLPCVIDPKHLFTNYIYRTSTSPGLRDHFKQYADEVIHKCLPASNSLVIEIGSNDGTLLSFFKNQGMKVLGIDPAQMIAAEATASGIETLSTFFTSELAQTIKDKHGPAEIIAANNVFAHIDNMEDLVKGIHCLLAPNGTFVFEASYLVDMFEKNVFDTIYHEHLCYHRVEPLETFFNRLGLTFFDVKKIPTKGGSIRGFIKHLHAKKPVLPIVKELMQLEKDMALDKIETYQRFSVLLDNIKVQLKAKLDVLKSENKSIVGYGASPPVTTTTYQFELGPYLDFFVDDNPIKQGRFSPGLHLPVLSSDSIYEKKPDCIIILAWQYADAIMKKHKQFLENGGMFIVPLPNIQIYQQ